MSRYDSVDHWELGDAYEIMVERLLQLTKRMSGFSQEDRHFVARRDWDWQGANEAWGVDFKSETISARLVSPELGFNVHSLMSFTAKLPAGGKEGAYHVHGEAVKLYLSGRGRELIG